MLFWIIQTSHLSNSPKDCEEIGILLYLLYSKTYSYIILNNWTFLREVLSTCNYSDVIHTKDFAKAEHVTFLPVYYTMFM